MWMDDYGPYLLELRTLLLELRSRASALEKYLGFQVARPKAPLLLDAVNRVHSVRAADGGSRCLGEAHMFGLACMDYSLHARHHLLDCDAFGKRAAAEHDDVQVVYW